MKDLSKKSFQTSLGAMLTVLSLIALYLSAILPSGRLTLYFISGIFLAPLLYERQPKIAFVVYAATALLSLLVLPGVILSLPYVLLFGHYGIGKYLIEEHSKRKRAFLYKWIYFNLSAALLYALCFQVIAGPWLASLPLFWLILLAQVAFVLYDFLYSRMVLFYDRYLRRGLMGN